MSSALEKKQADQSARLDIGGKAYDFPIVTGTERERGIDISKLLATTGCITLDEGYANTGSTTSAITFLDGDRGILRYRGYPIEAARRQLRFSRSRPPLDLRRAAQPGATTPPFAARSCGTRCCTRTCASSTAASRATPTRWPSSRPSSAPSRPSIKIRSTRPTRGRSKFRSTACWPSCPPSPPIAIRNRPASRSFIRRTTCRTTANFLQMMFAVPCEPYEVDPEAVAALNLLLIVHADHEQNCSTSTVRMVGSSNANLFASVSAGICALWGPLHGGANEAVRPDARKDHRRRRRRQEVRRPGQRQDEQLPPDGLRPPGL